MPKDPPKSETPFRRFENLLRQVIAVPKTEINRRDVEWRKKRKAKPSASQGSGIE